MLIKIDMLPDNGCLFSLFRATDSFYTACLSKSLEPARMQSLSCANTELCP